MLRFMLLEEGDWVRYGMAAMEYIQDTAWPTETWGQDHLLSAS